eukprot:3339811-Rhodomonas_salina.3
MPCSNTSICFIVRANSRTSALSSSAPTIASAPLPSSRVPSASSKATGALVTDSGSTDTGSTGVLVSTCDTFPVSFDTSSPSETCPGRFACSPGAVLLRVSEFPTKARRSVRPLGPFGTGTGEYRESCRRLLSPCAPPSGPAPSPDPDPSSPESTCNGLRIDANASMEVACMPPP